MIQKLSKKENPITVGGVVIRGKQYGRTLGFPTANLDRREYSRRKMKIKFGVYAGTAWVNWVDDRHPGFPLMTVIKGGKVFAAGVVVGPLDKKGLPKIEAHLIGFKENLYGKKIVCKLVKYIRPYKTFASEDSLKKQIYKDLKVIKKIVQKEKSIWKKENAVR